MMKTNNQQTKIKKKTNQQKVADTIKANHRSIVRLSEQYETKAPTDERAHAFPPMMPIRSETEMAMDFI